MRRVPVYMAADDHEFRDDYNDEIALRHPVAAQHRAGGLVLSACGRAGRPARYRRLASAAALHPLGDGIDPKRRRAAGMPSPLRLRVLRLRHARRSHDSQAVGRDHAAIMSDTQFIALRAWLKYTRRDGAAGRRPRFVAMDRRPSVLRGGGWRPGLRGALGQLAALPQSLPGCWTGARDAPVTSSSWPATTTATPTVRSRRRR